MRAVAQRADGRADHSQRRIRGAAAIATGSADGVGGRDRERGCRTRFRRNRHGCRDGVCGSAAAIAAAAADRLDHDAMAVEAVAVHARLDAGVGEHHRDSAAGTARPSRAAKAGGCTEGSSDARRIAGTAGPATAADRLGDDADGARGARHSREARGVDRHGSPGAAGAARSADAVGNRSRIRIAVAAGAAAAADRLGHGSVRQRALCREGARQGEADVSAGAAHAALAARRIKDAAGRSAHPAAAADRLTDDGHSGFARCRDRAAVRQHDCAGVAVLGATATLIVEQAAGRAAAGAASAGDRLGEYALGIRTGGGDHAAVGQLDIAD